MSSSETGRNAVGRPAGADGEKVRLDLLEAARQHFLKSEFKAVSLRQIAESAGVNPAMVNYYFGSKQGLYIAMVEDLVAKLEESVQALGEGHTLSVEDFSRTYTRLLVENPWWPNFIIREVLFSEGETREVMIQRFASAFAPRLLASINQDISNGHYREELNPALTMISMMGLTIFPFLAKPIMESVLNVTLDADFAEQLSEHNIALFQHGVLNPAGSGGTS